MFIFSFIFENESFLPGGLDMSPDKRFVPVFQLSRDSPGIDSYTNERRSNTFYSCGYFLPVLRETGETANLQALELTGQPENNQKLIEQFGIKCVSEKTDIENAAISTFLQLLENGKVIKSDSLVWRHPVSGDIVPKPVEKSSALPVTTKDFIMESKSYRYTVEGQNETIPERVKKNYQKYQKLYKTRRS